MTRTPERTIWINYLRSFITVLVVFHHSLLAYTTFAYFNEDIYINSTHVVVDQLRWLVLDILVNFNDIYFMSLMFLIGGLFLVKSIERKGHSTFLTDRFKRLLLPFLLLGTFFMLLAYIPAYYLSKGTFNLNHYIKDYFTIQRWPVGPPWFVWVLFLFNLLFALSYPMWSKAYHWIGTKLQHWGNQPLKLFLSLVLFTALLYIPLTWVLTTNSWVGIGPFDMQSNRFFLYSGYFFLGVVLGRMDFNNTLLSASSKIVRYWKIWWALALIIFLALTIIPRYLLPLVEQQKLSETLGYSLYYVLYILSCSTTSLAMLTSFKALVKRERSWWNSLSDNAYMIYLCHFVFVVWVQFLLLDYNMHASIKALLTFVISFSLSWVFSLQIRKIRIIEKYI